MNPGGSAPTCSVVVCTRDRPEQLGRCLAALSRQTHSPFDVLVVDNAPSDGRTREVAARWGVGYLLEPEAGLSRARNRGARECSGDIVAYIDDDAVAEPGWLAALAAEFADPSVGVVTGRCLPLEGGAEEEASALMQQWWSTGPERLRVDRQSEGWEILAIRGGIGVGLNMAFRRGLFAEWRGFHPRLGRGARVRGGEEQLAFVDLMRLGHAIVYTPEAVVRHPVPQRPADFQRFRSQARADYVAWLLFLIVEERSARRPALRVIREHLLRTPVPGVATRPVEEGRGRSSLVGTVLAGGASYLRSIFSWGR
jgi:glycosyltransferase involved in cell wall biosynthesis